MFSKNFPVFRETHSLCVTSNIASTASKISCVEYTGVTNTTSSPITRHIVTDCRNPIVLNTLLRISSNKPLIITGQHPIVVLYCVELTISNEKNKQSSARESFSKSPPADLCCSFSCSSFIS